MSCAGCRRDEGGVQCDHDSGVRDRESCGVGAAHISELENGVKEGDAALSAGDVVGSGAVSVQGSDVGVGDGGAEIVVGDTGEDCRGQSS